MATTSDVTTEPAIVVDPFCFRQFNDPSYTGARIEMSVAEFETAINTMFEAGDAGPLVDGYAPFCKHLFVSNFAQVQSSILPITEENAPLLVSDYEARSEKELPVLVRWFPKDKVVGDDGRLPVAQFIDVILYSREQIRKENAAMGEDSGSDAPWGVVSVKPQGVSYELPMQPITVMRNALGEDQGGSGVPLDPAAYRASVAFWREHAPVK
eukprot:CAMPEP_0185767168 /NCGR_PEP_ID=MMETSP1174-20130828/41789_1 /TAXON_ID=35687 /ORGANISM="Dictyocha speculum, Strain CCMP1381" /LENGTH=210 /DNA_ID=CAMNT_0028451231 /DNA_START=128 /DNA_END=760 /DNA_ORIENTATION=-